MQKLFYLLVFLLGIILSSTVVHAVDIAQPAPDFSLSGADGKTYALQELKGKVVVLEWTNHDCPFVKKHYSGGNMQSLQKDYTAQGVVWLSIISSAPGKEGHIDAETAQRLTEERKAAPTAVLFDGDGEIGRAYGAKTTPHLFIIDAEGKLAYMGGIDSIRSTDPADVAKADPYVRRALDELLAGKEVTQAVTRPYGCSIKY